VFDHPRVGKLKLRYERFAALNEPGPVPGTAGRFLAAFQAEPGSASAARLAALAEMAGRRDGV
jgi:hypothetical protein